MKISECDAKIASSNIDSDYKPILFGNASWSCSSIISTVLKQRLYTSLALHGTSGIVARMSFHFGSWFKED